MAKMSAGLPVCSNHVSPERGGARTQKSIPLLVFALPGLLPQHVPGDGPLSGSPLSYRVPLIASHSGPMQRRSQLSRMPSSRYNEKSYMCVHKNILYASDKAEASIALHVVLLYVFFWSSCASCITFAGLGLQCSAAVDAGLSPFAHWPNFDLRTSTKGMIAYAACPIQQVRHGLSNCIRLS